MAQFTDRVALVTGANSGIGREIALQLARRGATVAINYLFAPEAAEEVVGMIQADGGRAAAFKADVSDLNQVTDLIKAVTEEFGKIDILVNNAGTTRDNLIVRMSEDDWDLIINTNLKSAWNCSKAVVRGMMKARYGRIVNISSVSGIAGQGGQTNYSASKAGMIGLTKALAREVGSRGITVNAVAPGFVKTALTADLPEDLMGSLDDHLVIKRLGTVEDIANAVVFLASDEASYITGHILSVDGGLVMG